MSVNHKQRIALIASTVSVAVFALLLARVQLVAGPPELLAPLPIQPIFRLASEHHPYDDDWLHVQRMLNHKCVGCHRAGTDRTDLTSYAALMASKTSDDLPLVKPGSSKDSELWTYVCWNASADPTSHLPASPLMPEEEDEYLTVGQLEIVKRWIDNGALEYKLPATCNTKPLMTKDFPSAKQCSHCHPKQYAEWSRSMHAYAQLSPVFEAFNLSMIERTSGTIGTFCTRCHTPVGTALGENGSLRNIHRTRISQEGVTCIVCHRTASGRYKSNGRITVEPGELVDACIYGPFDAAPPEQSMPHPSVNRPYIKSSQFCGECHDVTSPNGVRLEEAFSEWQSSPAASQRITCQMCHMGPIQGKPFRDCERPLGRAAVVPGVSPESLPLRHLTSHSFAGPDYSLLPDTEFPEKLDWMYEVPYWDVRRLTPHQQIRLKALRKRNRAALEKSTQERYQLLANGVQMFVSVPKHLRQGHPIPIRVEVKSTLSGHNFPTGFTAERQLWVQVEVRAPSGRIIYRSGDLDSNGDLRDDHSLLVRQGKLAADYHLVNFQSKFIALAQRGTERSVVLSVNRDLQPLNILRPAAGIAASFGRPDAFRVSKASLPPLKSRTKTYRAQHTADCGQYLVSVRLQFRHLPPHLLDHIGVSHLKSKLEIVTISHVNRFVSVGQAVSAPPSLPILNRAFRGGKGRGAIR